jgi:hypothetical protein
MPRCTNRPALAMLAMVCVLVVWANKGTTTMATALTVTNRTKGTTTVATTTTTPAAQAPATHAAPVAPSTVALASWRIAGQPSTAKQATNGVGPAPKQGTVGYAALAAIAAGGCTMASMQAAITAVGLRGKHPALPLLHWLAKHRGYTFVCTKGVVTLG